MKKATLLAAVLSLSVLSLPALAATTPTQSPPPSARTVNKINLNTASASELAQSFKGIGQKRAAAIVSYREAHGPFKSIDELAQVRGLGKAFVNRNLKQLQDIFVI